MSHAFKTYLALCSRYNLYRLIPRSPACTIGNGNVSWVQVPEVAEGKVELSHFLLRFWREEFKGEDGVAALDNFGNSHLRFDRFPRRLNVEPARHLSQCWLVS